MSYAVGNFKVPFNEYGLAHYADTHTTDVIWHDNKEFDDVLVYDDYVQRRSSVFVRFLSKTHGGFLSMPLKLFFEAITKIGMAPGGTLEGRFTFAKHGNYYAIAAA